jgi:hypothetical protein
VAAGVEEAKRRLDELLGSYDTAAGELATETQVRKTRSWPRSWANFSLL